MSPLLLCQPVVQFCWVSLRDCQLSSDGDGSCSGSPWNDDEEDTERYTKAERWTEMHTRCVLRGHSDLSVLLKEEHSVHLTFLFVTASRRRCLSLFSLSHVCTALHSISIVYRQQSHFVDCRITSHWRIDVNLLSQSQTICRIEVSIYTHTSYCLLSHHFLSLSTNHTFE